MCGIAVELSRGTESPSVGRVEKMLARIAHRGDPENVGGVAAMPGAVLGCNRLAIVDRASADQPMWNVDRSLCVAFNGEIYNHRELRRDLVERGHRFATTSDTEVLLNAYAEWGRSAPEHLDGIFAFVVYDPAHATFLCARDRFGVKPLYWAEDGDTLLFASELKSFATIGVTPRTFPPGHAMAPGEQRCYDEREHRGDFGTADDAADELARLLDDAVRKRVRTDLPVGVIYSGGLDSAAVLGLALRHHPDVTAISVGFPGAPDLEFAERSCAELGVRHVVRHLSHDELVDRLPGIIRQAETFEMVDVMDAAVMAPAYEEAHKLGIKVVLVGDGSDELFAGYDLFREHPDPDALMRYRVTNLHRTDLQRLDRVSMLHSVEAREPFLDKAVVDFAWHLPMEYKQWDGIEKWVLRKAVSDVLPDYLAWRPKIRMPQGTGLLFQLIEHARRQGEGLDGELQRELGIDHPEMAYFLKSYLDCGYPAPDARYRKVGWDFAPNGYFVFQ